MTHEDFEKVIMEKLLDGEDEVFVMLKKQYSVATVISREFTGRGFFTAFNVPDNLAEISVNGRIDDVKACFDNSEVYYFILYITAGKIDTLEGFSTLNEWEENYSNAKVVHAYSDKREYDLNLPPHNL